MLDSGNGGIDMSDILSGDVRARLDEARAEAARRTGGLRLRIGGRDLAILRHWPDGVAVEAAEAGHLRGRADIYDGARHVAHCLIVASSEEGGELVCEFKRATPALDAAPADFAPEDGPAD